MVFPFLRNYLELHNYFKDPLRRLKLHLRELLRRASDDILYKRFSALESRSNRYGDNLENADDIIRRIRTFLKETYPHEPELPIADENELHKGLEYRFLEPYVDTNMTLIDTLIPPSKAHAQ